MQWFLSAIVCGWTLLASGVAQERTQGPRELEDLGPLLAPVRALHKIPAMGAAVIVDGKLVALGVDGVRKLGDEALVTKDDLWHLGSCTKAMTATLLARKVVARKIKWTTTLGDALPDLRDRMHADARSITIAQLLQHRAGLPSQPPMPLWRQLFEYEGTNLDARRDVAEAMLEVAPEAKPGGRFLYSNAGYMIAGAVAERISGRPWQELMRTELFAPLGMTCAGFGPPGSEDGVEQPWGHTETPEGTQPFFADNPPALGPAGTVHASLEDWASFVLLHLGQKSRSGQAVLGETPLVALHQPVAGAQYAFGWVVTRRPWAPGPIIWHNGSNTLWFCVAWISPESKFAVLVVSNHGDASKACDEVAATCIRRFHR